MGSSFEELDYRQTPLGELILRRRRVRSLGDLEVFEVKLGGAFLMSSITCEAEQALATTALQLLSGRSADVLIGGLGLGYTAQAALEYHGLSTLTVVEYLDDVLRWFRDGLTPLAPVLTGDSRCHLVQGDFFDWMARDAEAPGWDAILLDIDHGPGALLSEAHGPFYQAAGLRRLRAHLREDGVFGLWSAGPPEPEFLNRLRGALDRAEARPISFYNPLLDTEDVNTVYLARRGP